MKINFLKRYRESKNRWYIILKHKNYIPVFMALSTIILGTIGFWQNDRNFEFWDNLKFSIISSIKMFGLDFPSDPNELNFFIGVAIISAILTITITIIRVFVKDSLDKNQVKRTFRKDHIAVFGLGEASRSFLSSYSKGDRKKRIVIIESDPNNKKLEEYRNMGYGVVVGDSLSESTLQRLNFKRMKYAIIAMGSDGINIELAKRIITKYKEDQIKTEIKLIIHILNRDLDTLFVQNLELTDLKKNKDEHNEKVDDSKGWPIDNLRNVLCPKKIDKNKGNNEQNKNEQNDNAQKFKIDIKIFSFFNEAAEGLFEDYNIDGDSSKYLKSDKTFRSILIGDGELVKSVIYQMALISHLPNENTHKVYIVDKDASGLLVKIEKHLHYGKEKDSGNNEKYPKFEIEAVDIDKNSNDYFTNPVWTNDDLVNVIIAHDTEAENLDLAIELFNRTYMSKAMDETDKENIPKIIFAVYEQLLLSEIINSNEEAFKYFYTFGNSEKVLSYTSLIEEEKDLIARLIHSGYEGAYNSIVGYSKGVDNSNTNDNKESGKNWAESLKNYWKKAVNFVWYRPLTAIFCKREDVEDPIKIKWYDSAIYGDKLSSIAQAKYIDMRLKAMGLMRRYVFEDAKKKYSVSFENRVENDKLVQFENEMKKLMFEKEDASEDTHKKNTILFKINYGFENSNKKYKILIKKERKSIVFKLESTKTKEKNNEQKVIKEMLLDINKAILTKIFMEDEKLTKGKYYSNGILQKGELKDYSSEVTKYNIEVKAFEDDLEKKSGNLKENRKKLNEYSEKLFDSKYEVKYFPKDYNTLFEKMIRMEHNRWSAFQYLNGWEYSKIKDKNKKEHDCLKSIKEFKEKRLQISTINDIYSFLYLPKYLAEAGYEIVPITDDTGEAVD